MAIVQALRANERAIIRGRTAAAASNVISDLDTYFDAAWIPADALDTGAGSISNGEVVDQFIDRIRNVTSGLDLAYQGNATHNQRTSYAGPKYYDNGGSGLPYVWFANLNDIRWELTGTISPTEAAPQDVMILLRRRPSWSGESVIKSGGAFNIQDNGTLPTSDGYKFDLNTNKLGLTTGGYGGVNKVALLLAHMESTAEAFYLNNVDIYSTGTITNSDWNDMGIGGNTNMMGCEFYGLWIKSGTLTSTERDEIKAIVDNLITLNSIPAAYSNVHELTVNTRSSGATKEFFLSDDGGSTEWTAPGGSSIIWHEAGTAGARSFTAQNTITGATGTSFFRSAHTDVFVNHPLLSSVWVTAEITLSGIDEPFVPNHEQDNVD